MSLALERSLKIWFVVIVAILVINAIVCYRSTTILSEDDRWIIHTHQVISGLSDALSALKDAETGVRGFIITGDEAFLEPWNDSRSKIVNHLAELKRLTVDNSTQQHNLDVLQPEIDSRLDLLDSAVTTRRGPGLSAAQQMIAERTGKDRMDTVRRQIDAMIYTENLLLEQRQQTSADMSRRVIWTFTTGTLVALLFVVGSYILLQRSVGERAAAAAALRDQREWFQVTLSGIGDAIIATDTSANITFMNPVAEQVTGWSQSEVINLPISSVFQIVNEETRQPVENPVDKVLQC